MLSELLGPGLAGISSAYLALTLFAVMWSRGRSNDYVGAAQPISLLKPLHGDEPHLYENLKTFCVQDYRQYQIVFGLHREDDPALEVARRLQREFPRLDIEIVVSAQRHGSNPKVNNLINLLPKARHPWLVMADSDVSVTPYYLSVVSAPLADPSVGTVTCLYRGRARAGLWSRLGAAFINDWFAPSVLLTQLFGVQKYCAGATLALRAEVLKAIGGFEAVKDQLADDYWLGELPRRLGLCTVLSPMRVSTDAAERSFAELWAHDLRWMRTNRSLAPLGFAFLFVTLATPMLGLALLLSPVPVGIALVALGALLRVGLHLAQNPLRFGDLLLIPVRDLLLLAQWAVAMSGGAVDWRGQRLRMDGQGSDKLRPRS